MADTNTYTSKQNIKKYTTQAKFDAIDKSDVPVGTEYNIVGSITESDLDSELQAKINSTTVDQTYSATSKNAQSGKAVAGALSSKQDKLVSGQNIKTINGQSVLGSGDIPVGGGGSAGVSSIDGKTGDITLGDGLTIIEQTLQCTNIGSVRSETSSDLILQFMGNGGNSEPYGFYAPTTSSIGSITPTEPTFEPDIDIMIYSDVYLYERVTETDTSKLIKNETPLILTRGDNGFSGAVLMKAPALNDTDSDVYFIMNVSWADGGTMLAQINGLRLDLRITNNENGEFVGHIIIPSAKWVEGIITFIPESLLASGLDYRELPSIFANQNSFYVFRQGWTTESEFQGIEILRADTIDGTYSPVSQDNISINIVPYSI